MTLAETIERVKEEWRALLHELCRCPSTYEMDLGIYVEETARCCLGRYHEGVVHYNKATGGGDQFQWIEPEDQKRLNAEWARWEEESELRRQETRRALMDRCDPKWLKEYEEERDS